MKRKHEPSTPTEWQEAIDAASFFLHLHSARCYGLVEGGPEINTERCEELLRRGQAKGYTPTPDHIERLTRTFVEGVTR